MKQEDKELLLRYLCMALPYGVILRIAEHDVKLSFKNTWVYFGLDDEAKEYIKPYLRPMSSMTEEEMDAYANTGSFLYANGIPYNLVYTTEGLLFLLNNHFDIFGLIPKGLAIEVTEESNPYSIKKK